MAEKTDTDDGITIRQFLTKQDSLIDRLTATHTKRHTDGQKDTDRLIDQQKDRQEKDSHSFQQCLGTKIDRLDINIGQENEAKLEMTVGETN